MVKKSARVKQRRPSKLRCCSVFTFEAANEQFSCVFGTKYMSLNYVCFFWNTIPSVVDHPGSHMSGNLLTKNIRHGKLSSKELANGPLVNSLLVRKGDMHLHKT